MSNFDKEREEYEKACKEAKERAEKLKGRVKILSKFSQYARYRFTCEITGPVDYTADDVINYVDGGYSPFGGEAGISMKETDKTIWSGSVYTD